MIKFDFSTMIDSFLEEEQVKKYTAKKMQVYEKFLHSKMTGWTREIDRKTLDEIVAVSNEVKSHSDCLVVIGIGGSFMGSYAVNCALTPYFDDKSFQVIYAGTTLSSKYLKELLAYLEDKDFSVNVISKSGETMETVITYNLIKQLMENKYSSDEVQKRIIITTDKEKGRLREEVRNFSYQSFEIPDDIGGRYSIMTPAHLFPLSFNIDLEKFIKGYVQGKKYREDAYSYAVIRRCLFDSGKYIENYCVYEERLYYFTEWLKQLFGESEGKDGKGIFPVSTVNTRDLHSLGQFIQEGNKIIFETFIKVDESDKLTYCGEELYNINNIVLDSVKKAHYSGRVPCNLLTISKLDEENLGEVMYFFMMSAAFSGFLFDIDPFDQPGVEVYKKEVRENLKM